jgi:hypothetical protein
MRRIPPCFAVSLALAVSLTLTPLGTAGALRAQPASAPPASAPPTSAARAPNAPTSPGATASAGLGIVTVFRTEWAWEGAGPWAGGIALGVHPMGLPTPEVLLRYRPGGPVRANAPYGHLLELSLQAFIPGTQFSDATEPGFGVQLLTGGDRPWGERRFLRIKTGVAVLIERPDDDVTPAETALLPVVLLEVGWRLGGARNP